MHLCMYICIYVYIYIYIPLYMYTHTCVHIYMYKCIYIYIHTYKNIFNPTIRWFLFLGSFVGFSARQRSARSIKLMHL